MVACMYMYVLVHCNDYGSFVTIKIADSGHLVLDEQPQRVAAGLRLFLQGLGHAVTLGVRSPGHSYHQLYLKGVAIQ